MGASNVLRRFFLLVVLAAVVLAFLFRRWKASQRGRYVWDRFKLKVKVFGPLFHKSALSRFSRTLATLIRSGVPLLQALEIVGETVNNQVISRAVRDVQDSVREGESLATPLSKHASLTSMIEPILIAVMGAAVGGMVIALYMPLFNIINLVR
jgi:type IV pilus assembly protein PilC